MNVFVPSSAPYKNRPRTPHTPGKQKYRNKKIKCQGQIFDSIGERDRYLFLLSEQENGNIRNLQTQVTFKLEINGHHICKYIADFVYEQNAEGYRGSYDQGQVMPDGWIHVVEDFKGVITDVFALKAKMFKAQYGFDILITRRPSWRSSNAMEGTSWKIKK